MGTSSEVEKALAFCLGLIAFNRKLNGGLGLYDQFEQVARQAAASGRLKGLRSMISDLVEGAREEMTPERYLELDAFLIAEVGHGVIEHDRNAARRLKAVLKHGAIQNEQEFRLVLSRVEQLVSSEPDNEQVAALNSLLAAWEAPRN